MRQAVQGSATSPLIESATIRAFAAPGALGQRPLLGNLCRVELAKEAPIDAPHGGHDLTHCISWPHEQHSASVACWNSQGGSIQCCGHGLLSCAKVWLEHWRGDGYLMMSGTAVACRQHAGLIWLGFPRVPADEQPGQSWITQQVGISAIACATAGGDDGYLIIQLPEGSDLTLIATPDATLANYTRRALIITCAAAQGQNTYGENIHFRYFAPQYGAPEDSATGSAMRVLASFWQSKGMGDHLRAWQRSVRGGLLLSSLEANTAWVGGRALREDEASV